MPSFKVKDLMVQIQGEGDALDAANQAQFCLNTRQCFFPTLCRWNTLNCGFFTPCFTFTCPWRTRIPWEICNFQSICGGSSELPIDDPRTPVINPPIAIGGGNLNLLREQLKQALAEVEAEARASDERLAPQTVDQVEALERKLTEALEELQARKAALQGGKQGD